MLEPPALHPVRAAYCSLVDSGVLTPDPAQNDANARLSDIACALEAAETKRGLRRLFGAPKPIPGAYVWGEVGRGKTMLMDLFADNAGIVRKRRVHFHQFMDEVHTAIAAFRASDSGAKGRRDPIPFITAPILAETRLLCLDEFHVTDITNAMLLGRLFQALFAGGLTLIATSNVRPDDLYHNGLNRQLVLPFIALLKERTHVLELKSATDYRRLMLAGQKVFSVGPPKATRQDMDAIWQKLTGGQDGHEGHVRSLGRDIVVPHQSLGVARFGFAELCDVPLGSRDYLRLVEAFHTFIIDEVPVFDARNANAAQRFILFIDTLYDRGAKLAAGFAAPLADLNGNERMRLAFARCQSRLVEMQSEDYLAEPVGRDDD